MQRILTRTEAERLEGLDPRFRDAACEVVGEMNSRCTERPYSLHVVFGFRSIEEQARIYAQGRTTPGPIVTLAKPGESAHNYGLAIDLALIGYDGHYLADRHSAWRELGELAESKGLESGARFKSPDLGHIQAANWRSLIGGQA